MKEENINIVEEWRDVAGYEGFYQVSNLGRVKSLARPVLNRYNDNVSDRILRHSVIKGYHSVTFSIKRHKKTFKVHRLVAQAFLPNPNNYDQINHKDGDKGNNCVNNLEWCNASYNNLHKFNVLGYTMSDELREKLSKAHKCFKWSEDKKQNLSKVLKGRKKPGANKKVRCITTGEVFESIQEAAKVKNIQASNITMCCRGRIKFAKKLAWEYVKGE